MLDFLRLVKRFILVLPFGTKIYSFLREVYREGIRFYSRLLRCYSRWHAKGGTENTFSWQGFSVTEGVDDIYYVSAMQDGMDNHIKRVEAIHALLKDRPRLEIFDVGANIGIYTLLFSRLPGARVSAFEPVRKTFSYLKRNVEANRLDNVKVEDFGLSDAEKELFIAPSGEARKSTVFSVLADPQSRLGKELGEMARFSTLDGYCAKHGIEHIDFLKIDVEGHEPEVLKGASATIQRCLPILQVEVAHDSPQRYKPSSEVFNILGSWGYSLFGWNGTTLEPIASIESWAQADHLDLDIVALPKQK